PNMAVKKAVSAIKAALAGKTAATKQASPATKAAPAKPVPAKKAAPAGNAALAKPVPPKKAASPRKAVAARPVPGKTPAPTKTTTKTTSKATTSKGAGTKGAAKTTAKALTDVATTPVSPSVPRRGAKATATAAPLRAHRAGASSSSSARSQRLQVREDETPWTAKELEAVRAELEADIARLREEISAAEYDLAGLMRDAGEGAGDDQADAGTKTFEREQEISLANNARGMYEQSVHALERIEDGSYGICESCGSPIGKNRLLAFPRATLCVPCKSKQERR
ncbi:MAG TPA: TraR/DksA C4-type zinc finger protein, partial [Dermatophilaceae bacterium]|nr:TraR/DksA C4-type zinc finger protein [Dermatophilaceae bacterium]